MKVKDLIKLLQTQYKPNQEIAHALWSRDDIKCNELTDAQKDEIIASVDHYASAEYGITWDTIRDATLDYINELTNTILITVSGGYVDDVENLPEGWGSEINDLDMEDEYPSPVPPNVVRITVKGDVVGKVENLPEGWGYVIDDQD